MNGRDKCELLNEVRQKIAEKNNIEFTVYECTFEGDCTGTCPKCESEVRYLEEELAKKQARGEKINLEGIFSLEETCPTWIDKVPWSEVGDVVKDGDMPEPPRLRRKDIYDNLGDFVPLSGDIKVPPVEKIPELEEEEARVIEEIEMIAEEIKIIERKIEAGNEDEDIKFQLKILEERLKALKLKLKNVRDDIKILKKELRRRELDMKISSLLHEGCVLKVKIQKIEDEIKAGHTNKEREEELKKLEQELNNVMDKLEELEKVTDLDEDVDTAEEDE